MWQTKLMSVTFLPYINPVKIQKRVCHDRFKPYSNLEDIKQVLKTSSQHLLLWSFKIVGVSKRFETPVMDLLDIFYIYINVGTGLSQQDTVAVGVWGKKSRCDLGLSYTYHWILFIDQPLFLKGEGRERDLQNLTCDIGKFDEGFVKFAIFSKKKWFCGGQQNLICFLILVIIIWVGVFKYISILKWCQCYYGYYSSRVLQNLLL